MEMAEISYQERLQGALWGMFVGDALAMPAHWYYDVAALRRDYGTIRDYLAPLQQHPSSIMSRASTGEAGRGKQVGDIVGTVILHGKKERWAQAGLHYHFGLNRGDNTLNLLCVRLLLRTMVEHGDYDAGRYLAEYVAFMTTPDTHDDTYAESYHRAFFANYARGVSAEQCAGREGHDTASIGGLVGLPPVIIAGLRGGNVDSLLLTHLRLTHRSTRLERYALALGRLLTDVLYHPGENIRSRASQAAATLGFPAASVIDRVERAGCSDLEVIGGMLSPACYIDQSFPAVLYLAARYANDFEGALVANTNVGGDNCHRGAVLGALLGAALGVRAIPDRWITGLAAHSELAGEIESFVDRFG